MAIVNNKLQQVLDELSLDKANGKYLNTISGNYGLHRPVSGLSDAQWRALTKVLALQYKQVANKFRDVLEIILGPQHTQVSSLVEDAPAGAKVLTIHDVSKFPQVGTIVLDEGQANAESVVYKFVDYVASTVFLEEGTQFAHFADAGDDEVLILGNPSSTSIDVMNSELLPHDFSDGRKYTVVVGRGTDKEEIVLLEDVTDYLPVSPTSTITVSPLVSTHERPDPNPGVTFLSNPYKADSFHIVVENIGIIPEQGTILLEYGGDLHFTQVISREPESNTAVLKYSLPTAFSASQKVQVIPFTSTVALASVQVKGGNWDVIQSSPRLVEILIPSVIGDGQGLRTASYIHVNIDDSDVGYYTLNSEADPGDLTLDVGTLDETWPKSGVLQLKDQFTVGPTDEISAFSQHDGLALHIPHGVKNFQPTGNSAEYYNPTYSVEGNFTLTDGDLYGAQKATFPGPYIYNPARLAPSRAGETTLVTPLAVPTTLALSVEPSATPTSIEVESAVNFPAGVFTFTLGTELMTGTAWYPKASAEATGFSVGTSSLTINPLDFANFPTIPGFRVLLDDIEIAYVTNINTGTGVISFSEPIQGTFTFPTVTLVRDVISVTQIDSPHTGAVSIPQRVPETLTDFPQSLITYDYLNAEAVVVPYSEIELSDAAGFPEADGFGVVNYGYSDAEDFAYTSRTGNTLAFATPFIPTIPHDAGVDVMASRGYSTPDPEGYGFPLRMPLDPAEVLQFLIDLVRAAGVRVQFIHHR